MMIIAISSVTEIAAEGTNGHPIAEGSSVLAMIFHAGPVVQVIMAGLLCLSLICWGIVVAKSLKLRKVFKESEIFSELFVNASSLEAMEKESKRFTESHLAHVFRVGRAEMIRVKQLLTASSYSHPYNQNDILLENVDRALQASVISKRKKLQHLLPFLATTGSTAPFIGLFGTVWGIMTSFQNIGLMGSANLAVVAPGIAEALVATAMGLAVAIPAVVAYNHFSTKIQLIEDDMLQFSADFLNTLKTDLLVHSTSSATNVGQFCIVRERKGMCGCLERDSAKTG